VGTPSSYSNDARRQAAHILSRPPFVSSPSHIPDPLAGVLHAIGRAASDVFEKPADWLGHHLSIGAHDIFGRFTWPAVILIAVVAGVVIGTLLIRRRTRIGPPTHVTVLGATPAREDAGMLEAAADTAETNGELEEAVRLRFRAGLARLEAAGVIAGYIVTTTEQVRRTVRNPTFDSLARRHDAIAYAGQRASPTDVGSARESWPKVIDEAAPVGTGRRT
jgi:hypothetical protein